MMIPLMSSEDTELLYSSYIKKSKGDEKNH